MGLQVWKGLLYVLTLPWPKGDSGYVPKSSYHPPWLYLPSLNTSNVAATQSPDGAHLLCVQTNFPSSRSVHQVLPFGALAFSSGVGYLLIFYICLYFSCTTETLPT